MNQAISTSAVGQSVTARLNQITAQVKAELGPENTAIETDGRALEAKRSTLDAAAFQTQAQALQARANALRQKADLRQREVQATEQKAVNRIAQELDPVVRNLYQQKHCSVLVDKGSVINAQSGHGHDRSKPSPASTPGLRRSPSIANTRYRGVRAGALIEDGGSAPKTHAGSALLRDPGSRWSWGNSPRSRAPHCSMRGR